MKLETLKKGNALKYRLESFTGFKESMDRYLKDVKGKDTYTSYEVEHLGNDLKRIIEGLGQDPPLDNSTASNIVEEYLKFVHALSSLADVKCKSLNTELEALQDEST